MQLTDTQLNRLFAAGHERLGGALLELVSLASLGSASARQAVAVILESSPELAAIASDIDQRDRARDQGIEDAAAGRKPLYTTTETGYACRGRTISGGPETAVAYAYVQAYTANQ